MTEALISETATIAIGLLIAGVWTAAAMAVLVHFSRED